MGEKEGECDTSSWGGGEDGDGELNIDSVTTAASAHGVLSGEVWICLVEGGGEGEPNIDSVTTAAAAHGTSSFVVSIGEGVGAGLFCVCVNGLLVEVNGTHTGMDPFLIQVPLIAGFCVYCVSGVE